MTPFRRRLLLIVAGGFAVRLTLMLLTDGSRFDIGNYQRTLDALKVGGTGVYGLITPVEWPYGPGWFPWLLVADGLDHVVPFSVAERLGTALADAGLALLTADLLGRFGGDARQRLAAAAVLSFGPLSVLEAGWFGQLDSPAALASLAALWVWTRPGQRARGALTGGLIAVAALIKTVPLVLVLPFAAAARDGRERGAVLGAGIGGVLVLTLPFYLRTPEAVSALGGYHGIPGFGGLGLVLRPTFAAHVLAGVPGTRVDGLLAFLRDDATTLVLVPALAALAVLLFRRRLDVLTGICVTWLVVYVFGVNFSVTYLCWSMPFFLVRGHVRGVLAVQLAVTPLTLLFTGAYSPPLAVIYLVYTAVMTVLWGYGVALLAWLATRGVPVAVADSPGATAVS